MIAKELPRDTAQAYGRFLETLPTLVDLARLTANNPKETYSYRGFLVGAAGFAAKHNDDLVVVTAGNWKPNQGKQKICAEERVEGKMTKIGATALIGLVVVATTDPTQIYDITGARTATLGLCTDCCELLSDSPFVGDDMLVVTAGLDKDVYQAYRWADRGVTEPRARWLGNLGTVKDTYDRHLSQADAALNPAEIAAQILASPAAA